MSVRNRTKGKIKKGRKQHHHDGSSITSSDGSEFDPSLTSRRRKERSSNKNRLSRQERWNSGIRTHFEVLLLILSVGLLFFGKPLGDRLRTRPAPPPPPPLSKETIPSEDQNYTNWFLKHFICDAPEAFCHPSLEAVPSRRTHLAREYIPGGRTILMLPRKYLIWDLDAMKVEWIQKELLEARHEKTNNPLDSGAFLAAYLSKRKMESKKDDHMMPFLQILPSYATLKEYHPSLWMPSEVKLLLGETTQASRTILAFHDMMHSEYRAFRTYSQSFASIIPLEEYLAMRIHVMSRSFGTGPPDSSEASPQDINFYRSKAGVNLDMGCRAMSPILDMWDHHANPNVEWRYDPYKKAYWIQSSSHGVPQGHDIMVSYGRYTDTHLFSKFGFVNGDGSGWTEASIASFHTLHNVGLGPQFSYISFEDAKKHDQKDHESLARYLQFDEGYPHCLDPLQNSTSLDFKRLKFRHLKLISQNAPSWVTRMQPRNSTSVPAPSSDTPITTEVPNFRRNSKLDLRNLLSTCRLITLTEEDYNGKAQEILTAHLGSSDPLLILKQSHASEYRALSCLERLTAVALSRYPSTVSKDMHFLIKEGRDPSFFRSKMYNVLQVRLAELQSLEVLRNIAVTGRKAMMEQGVRNGEKVVPVRREACPLQWTLDVLSNEK